MHVLLITWYFPPYQSAGASRLGQLTKYLRLAGHRVSVVTGRPSDLPSLTDIVTAAEIHYAANIDLNAVPRSVLGKSSVREHGYELSRLGRFQWLGRAYKQLMHFPDAQVGWIVPALLSARRIDRPDVVLSSSPAPSAHIAAGLFARSRHIPWIAEYRDLWTDGPAFRRWWPARPLENGIEAALIRRASIVTTTTKGMAEILSARLGRRVEHIPNGFDPEDFTGAVTTEPGLFAHTGTVYVTFDTSLLLRALPLVRRPIRMVFAGRNLADLPQKVRDRGGTGVDLVGPLERSMAIGLMRRAEANLLFLWDRKHRLAHVNVTQKLYEYIAAGRPIIVIGHDQGEAATIVRDSGLAIFVRTAEELARALEHVPPLTPDSDVIRRYEYQRLAARFVDLFDQALRNGGGGTGTLSK